MPGETDAIAEGLWRRIRDVVLATERLERFNFSPESEAGAPTTQPLATLVPDAPSREALARELVLRAFAAAADAVNFRILSALRGEEPVPLDELARLVGLPSLAVGERVSDLVQVGLAVRVLERAAVEATAAGRGYVAVVEDVVARLAARCAEGFPGLLA